MFGFLRRLFGIRPPPPQLGGRVRPSPARVAADLVERARAGDQNAMAVLAEIGHAARAGNPRGLWAHALVEAYARRTAPATVGEAPLPPATSDLVAAVHAPDTLVPAVGLLCTRCRDGAAVATLALLHGPAITDARVDEWAASCFGRDGDSRAFCVGVRYPRGEPSNVKVDEPHAAARAVGRVVGAARAAQRMIVGKDAVATFDPAAARDLGERV